MDARYSVTRGCVVSTPRRRGEVTTRSKRLRGLLGPQTEAAARIQLHHEVQVVVLEIRKEDACIVEEDHIGEFELCEAIRRVGADPSLEVGIQLEERREVVLELREAGHDLADHPRPQEPGGFRQAGIR